MTMHVSLPTTRSFVPVPEFVVEVDDAVVVHSPHDMVITRFVQK